jgi:hypothetical protein
MRALARLADLFLRPESVLRQRGGPNATDSPSLRAAPAGGPMNTPTSDFILEKYKADRTHELELNKVQGTLEANDDVRSRGAERRSAARAGSRSRSRYGETSTPTSLTVGRSCGRCWRGGSHTSRTRCSPSTSTPRYEPRPAHMRDRRVHTSTRNRRSHDGCDFWVEWCGRYRSSIQGTGLAGLAPVSWTPIL